MRRLSKALIVVLFQGLADSLYIPVTGTHTTSIFAHSLAVVFDLNAGELTWLILSILPFLLLAC